MKRKHLTLLILLSLVLVSCTGWTSETDEQLVCDMSRTELLFDILVYSLLANLIIGKK